MTGSGLVMRIIGVLSLVLLLGGCAESAFTIASLAVSGVSYITTGKDVSDHALSAMVGQDCAMLRVVQDKPICHDYEREPDRGTAVALAAIPMPHPNERPGAAIDISSLDIVIPSKGVPVTDGGSWQPVPAIATHAMPYMIQAGSAPTTISMDWLEASSAYLQGFGPGAEPFALVQEDGTLEVFIHRRAADGGDKTELVFRVIGYSRNAGSFIGLTVGNRFHRIADIIV